MRNEALERLDGLVGTWRLTLSDAWFLEPAGTEVHGSATIEWLGDAFLIVRHQLEGQATFAIGRSDANDAYHALYHDNRGVCRVFAMHFGDGRWTPEPRGPRLPPALPRPRGGGSHCGTLGGIRGRGPNVEEGLRPRLRSGMRGTWRSSILPLRCGPAWPQAGI
jgi:hypothetical protein